MNVFSSSLSRLKRFDHGGSISGTVAVNFGAAALAAIASIVFARILGISNYGLYVYVISATGLVGGVATLGLPTLITRQTAAWASIGEWSQFNGIIRFGIVASLVSSSLFGLLILASSRFLGEIRHAPHFYTALTLGVGVMILQCLDNTIAGALQGMHVIAQSLIPQAVVVPCCLIIVILTSHLIGSRPDALELLGVQLGVSFVVEIYQVWNLYHRRPVECVGRGHRIAVRAWLVSSLPFWGNGILFLINIQADTLLLGYYRGSSSAAVYLVGTRGAQVVVLVLSAIATAIQPRIAGLHNTGDRAAVNRIVTQTTRLGFLVASAWALFFFGFGKVLIKLLYGAPFIAATSVLLILVLARLVNASVGSLGPYLAMTGKEHLLLKMLAVESVANVLLNILLIPRWGLNGSALATGVSMSIVNVGLAVYVFRKWGVDVSIIGAAA